MAQLPNTPADNIDFNLLLQSFESLGLFDEHVVSYACEIAVDYALPGPHPKHNLKTNFVTGHGLMIYREEDDPLWPERNRIMDCAFVPPVLPPWRSCCQSHSSPSFESQCNFIRTSPPHREPWPRQHFECCNSPRLCPAASTQQPFSTH